MISLSRPGDNHATVEDGLGTVERCLVHDRLEIALCRDAVVRALDLPNVDRVPNSGAGHVHVFTAYRVAGEPADAVTMRDRRAVLAELQAAEAEEDAD